MGDSGSRDGDADGGVLAVLELLAEEAPQSAYEALLDEARRGDADPARLAALTHAVALARSVRASASRRKQREAALTALVDTAHDLTSPTTSTACCA